MEDRTASPLAERLRDVRVDLRRDLDVSRHVFRGKPAYVVRDPLTFHNRRLEVEDYAVISAIHSSRSLAETFEALVQAGTLTPDREEEFYELVLALHAGGFLRLPISDHQSLYRRYQARERFQRRARIIGFLFLRISLWNPDAFLNRTIRYVRPLFGKTACLLWMLMMAVAAVVACRHGKGLMEPIEGVLAASNLPLLFAMLIVLKLVHELGHAYACKHYGGHVPEMGVYLIALTPCAYVDAGACWGCPSRWHRMVVCLAGMYVESVVAACALFLWACMDPSWLRSVAYNTIVLAGVATVLFNLNPLARFDGYYLLSDFLEIPNLRRRSARCVLGLLKRHLLGVVTEDVPKEAKMRVLLIGYGLAAAVYRVFLLLAIGALLSWRLGMLGFALASVFLGMTAWGIVIRLGRYLGSSKETQPVRWASLTLGAVLLIGLPGALCWVPIPSTVRAAGILEQEGDAVLRVTHAGFLSRLDVSSGAAVQEGQVVARLSHDLRGESVLLARARLDVSRLRHDAMVATDPSLAREEAARIRAYEKDIETQLALANQLTLRTPIAGRIFLETDEVPPGRYLPEGFPLARISSGSWRVKAILSESQLAEASCRVGDHVVFRPKGAPGHAATGRVSRINPAGSRVIEDAAFTHAGGGIIAVQGQTGEAQQPYFEVTIALEDAPAPVLRHGMTGVAYLKGASEPMAARATRALIRFVNKLRER